MKKIKIIAVLMVGLLAGTIVTALPASRDENIDLQLTPPEDPHPLSGFFRLFVRAYDKDSIQPIQNARVTIIPGVMDFYFISIIGRRIPVPYIQKRFTDANGSYTVDYDDYEGVSEIKIILSKSGYLPAIKTAVINDDFINVDFPLKKIMR